MPVIKGPLCVVGGSGLRPLLSWGHCQLQSRLAKFVGPRLCPPHEPVMSSAMTVLQPKWDMICSG